MPKIEVASVECPGCGALYTALLRDREPDSPIQCVECDALLPSEMNGRFVGEVITRQN